jgi:ribosomal protein S14
MQKLQEAYMSDGTVECKLCGEKVGLVHIDKKLGGLCRDCVREVHPPEMIIIDANSSGQLYNVHAGKYEFDMTIADFEVCGWHVAEISVREENGVTRTSYLLKYYGKKRCGRYLDYEYWPYACYECHLNGCLTMRRPEDNGLSVRPNRNLYMS